MKLLRLKGYIREENRRTGPLLTLTWGSIKFHGKKHMWTHKSNKTKAKSQILNISEFSNHHNKIPWASKYLKNDPDVGCQAYEAVLWGNNHTPSPINKCEKQLMKGFAVLPYSHAVSERIGRLLKQKQIQVSNEQEKKNHQQHFSRPKQQDKTDRPSSKMVYKINCTQSDFVY